MTAQPHRLSPTELRLKLRRSGYPVPAELERAAERHSTRLRQRMATARHKRARDLLRPQIEAIAADISQTAANLAKYHEAPPEAKAALLTAVDRALAVYLRRRFGDGSKNARSVVVDS